MSRQSMEMLMAMLQMKQLEVATLKVANQTLRERIQWLEHLASEFQDQLYQKNDTPEDSKHEPIGFRGSKD